MSAEIVIRFWSNLFQGDGRGKIIPPKSPYGPDQFGSYKGFLFSNPQLVLASNAFICPALPVEGGAP